MRKEVLHRLLLSSLLILASTSSLAHEEATLMGLPNGLTLQGTVATSYRSLAKVERNERWVIPGFLMGGEALPMPKGFHLDEVMLIGTYGEGDSYAYIKAGQHAGADGLAVEHALVGHRIGSMVLIEAGRMSASMSPYQAPHPSQTPFADALLIYDALWGRQYNDTGVRLRSQLFETGLEAGIEYWQGDAFPAKRQRGAEGAYDLYLEHTGRVENANWRFGLFHYKGEANSRVDSRYSSEHNHGVDTVNIPVYYFDGETQVQGVHGRLEWGDPGFRIGGEGEYQISQSEGQLRDATRLAPLETVYKGFWWSLYQRTGAHLVALRYERLQFENNLAGAAATALATQALLLADKDPYRMSVAYNFQWDDSLKLRAEWLRDFTSIKKKDMAVLGMIWAKQAQVSTLQD
jgi:hypothetical protein